MTTNGTENAPAQGDAGPRTLTGIVTAVNPKGVRLKGHDGYLNFSKWPEEPIIAPNKGDQVGLLLDSSGFVRRLDILETQHAPAPSEGSDGWAPEPALPAEPPPMSMSMKDRLIIRQTAIKASAEFCASRPDLKSADLLALAERLEAWVVRPMGEGAHASP